MSALSFREDFKKVQWGRTLALNMMRAFAAGIVWGIVMLMTGNGSGSPDSPRWFLMPFFLPAAYLGILPIFLITSKIITSTLGQLGEMGVGMMTLLLGLGLAVGDPIVYLVHKLKPSLVPTEKFSFINIVLILFVLDPTKI
jgi:hypothetical protein